MELYDVILNDIGDVKGDLLSPKELKTINAILSEMNYVMSRCSEYPCDKIISNRCSILQHGGNYISFKKLEDEYILVTFGKTDSHSQSYKFNNMRFGYADNFFTEGNVRFRVKCDTIEGVVDFYNNVIFKGNFIENIMKGNRI